MTNQIKDIKVNESERLELIKVANMIEASGVMNYGSVKIQIRAGKATLITLEKTVRLD